MTIQEFKAHLAQELDEWLFNQPTPNNRRTHLAKLIGKSASQVSAMLNHPESISEEAIIMITKRVPGFGGKYAEYLEVIYAERMGEDAPAAPAVSAATLGKWERQARGLVASGEKILDEIRSMKDNMKK